MGENLTKALQDSWWWKTRGDRSSLLYLKGVEALEGENYVKAVSYFSRAAKAGEAQGAVMLAAGAEDQISSFLTKVPKGRADKSIIDAALNANPHACFMMYQEFSGRQQIEDAVKWLNRAGELGSIFALIDLAQYANEAGDEDRALGYLERAARAGSGEAAADAARICHDSPRRGQAEEEAWWERAATLGDVDGLRVTGFTKMIFGERDLGESRLKSAAQSGDILSMEVLAQAYEELGELGSAFVRYKKAANAGSAYALGKYGLLLCKRGDFGPGFAALEEAGEKGDADAFANLGEMMLADNQAAKARTYFQRAVRLGSRTAAARLREI